MRLNKEIRDTILDRVMERRLAATEKKLRALELLVGDALHAALYTPAPEGVDLEGWAASDDEVKVYIRWLDVDDQDVLAYPSEKDPKIRMTSRRFRFKTSRRFFVCREETYRASIDHEEAMKVKEYKKWFDALVSATELRSQIRSHVRPLLFSATTVKALIKIWPEAEPFIPERAKRASTALVPVSQVRAVNKLVELP